MKTAASKLPGPRANVGFLIGAGRSGTTLLYKLLCLHPEVGYISSVEHRLPWLPTSLTGRYRLRRYSSKLTHWFRERDDVRLERRPLIRHLTPLPAEGQAIFAHCGLPPYVEPACRPDERVMARLRRSFAKLQEASRATVLVSKCGACNPWIPALSAAFPDARYINVVRDGREVAASLARGDRWHQTPLWWDEGRRTPAQAVAEGEDLLRLCARHWVEETMRIAHALTAVDPAHVLSVRYEDLVASPIEQMRSVLAFLGLERRLDYEWALKTLKLGQRSPSWCSAWSTDQVEIVNREQGEHLARSGYAS